MGGVNDKIKLQLLWHGERAELSCCRQHDISVLNNDDEA